MVLKFFQLKSAFFSLGMVSVLSLSGCFSNQNVQDDSDAFKNKPIVMGSPNPLNLPETKPQSISSTKMSGQMLYQILVAEMLVQTHHPIEAYQLMMPLALKSKDIGLVKRAFELSMATYNVKEIEKAAKLLRQVNPTDPSGWRASYLLSVALGHTKEAVQEWKTYLKVSKVPFDEQIIITAKRIEMTVAKKPGMAFMTALEQNYSEHRSMVLAIGLTAYAYADYQKALEAFWKAKALFKESENPSIYSDIHGYLSGCYFELHQAKQGLKKLQPYLVAHPNDWTFQQNYARLEVSAGQLEAAAARYKNILKHQPNSIKSQLALSLILLERRQFKQADALLQDLLKSPKQKNIAHYYLGISNKAQNNPVIALQQFKQVVTGPYLIKANVNQAEILYQEKGFKSAMTFLDHKIKAFHNRPKILTKLWQVKGEVYRNENQIKPALASYQKAIKIDDKNVDAMFGLSVLYYDKNEFSHYVDVLQQVLSVKPQQADALNALGYYYLIEKHDLVKAQQYINLALEASPHSYYILDSKGWLLYAQKDFKSAQKVLHEALSYQLDDEVLIHLIKTKWALNQKQDAEALWQKYHQEFPDNQRLQNIIKTLQESKIN